VSAMDTTELVRRERGRLFGLAYRLLGTVSDAEDAVQETFLRWEQADHGAIENPEGWLTTVITRYCLDQLRAARRQRETYVGTWLPEPLVAVEGAGADDPADKPRMSLPWVAVRLLCPCKIAAVSGVPWLNQVAAAAGSRAGGLRNTPPPAVPGRRRASAPRSASRWGDPPR
jgi:sigma-70-like protein